MTSWFSTEIVYRIIGVGYQPSGEKIDLEFNCILFGFEIHYWASLATRAGARFPCPAVPALAPSMQSR